MGTVDVSFLFQRIIVSRCIMYWIYHATVFHVDIFCVFNQLSCSLFTCEIHQIDGIITENYSTVRGEVDCN